MAWHLGHTISRFCVREGAGVVVEKPEDLPALDRCAIACAGKEAEQQLLKIEDPAGCRNDDQAVDELVEHREAASNLTEDLLDDMGSALRQAAEEIHRRTQAALTSPMHLPGCVEPGVIAGILKDALTQYQREVPQTLEAQIE
jgi:hypothetical protein